MTYERLKRQQRWMLPVLAVLFVLNFAAFVNGRLMPPAAHLAALDMDESWPESDAFFNFTLTDGSHHFSAFAENGPDCEKGKRHVHVRTIREEGNQFTPRVRIHTNVQSSVHSNVQTNVARDVATEVVSDILADTESSGSKEHRVVIRYR